MAFLDEVKLHIKAGDGGDGVVRWRHEKFKPKSGPGGGDGGRGGDVYAEGISDLAYLEFYKHKKSFFAENGIIGGNLGKYGRNGKDLILRFPRGTVLKNLFTGEEFELKNIDDKILILKGGNGGYGNEHFKSSTNTTPLEWTPGKKGEEADFYIELRLFADIGLIGFPSAGKSTLLNSLTNSRSKVGEYHFTTLDPHLGDMYGYIIADIPGIIEGASFGRGLGYKFLRHIRRTDTIVHLISLESEDPIVDYEIVRSELLNYGEGLDKKDELILLTKDDLINKNEIDKIIVKFKNKVKHDMIYSITAYDEESIKKFKSVLMEFLDKKHKV